MPPSFQRHTAYAYMQNRDTRRAGKAGESTNTQTTAGGGLHGGSWTASVEEETRSNMATSSIDSSAPAN